MYNVQVFVNDGALISCELFRASDRPPIKRLPYLMF